MEYFKQNIKNIAIVGGMGTGKTTLAESIAFVAGAITKKGEAMTNNESLFLMWTNLYQRICCAIKNAFLRYV